jgi:hypothetical protein
VKALTLRIHPVTIGLILLIGLPSIAIAAGTILNPPVTVTGSSTNALLTATNHGSGGSPVAILGRSTNGRGVVGETSFNSTSQSNRESGVVGNDTSTNGTFNAGVRGISNVGSGVVGSSTSGTAIVGQTSAFRSDGTANQSGVLGQDLSGPHPTLNSGVLGTSTDGFGVQGISELNFGMYAQSTYSYGLRATASLGIAVYGTSQTNDAAEFESFATSASRAEVMELFARNGADIIGAFGAICPQSGYDEVAKLTNTGSLILCGTVTENGSPQSVTRTSNNEVVVSYSARSASPTIEDDGEGTLHDGHTNVALDHTFASTIDERSYYLVFVTPQGPLAGTLYVSHKTRDGFSVDESGQEHASITFDYRIVARPLDSSWAHLPLYEKMPSRLESHSIRS